MKKGKIATKIDKKSKRTEYHTRFGELEVQNNQRRKNQVCSFFFWRANYSVFFVRNTSKRHKWVGK